MLIFSILKFASTTPDTGLWISTKFYRSDQCQSFGFLALIVFWTVMPLDVLNFVGANPDTCVLGDFHQTLQE